MQALVAGAGLLVDVALHLNDHVKCKIRVGVTMTKESAMEKDRR